MVGKRWLQIVMLVGVLTFLPFPVNPDGGFFFPPTVGTADQIAQVKQEVLIAFHGTYEEMQEDPKVISRATYVIRSFYDGTTEDFAWVMPLPNTPTAIEAHRDSSLFEYLEDETTPHFLHGTYEPMTYGCVCAMPMAGNDVVGEGLVTVEAEGTAGPYDYAALTASGSTALVDWLQSNGYDIPTEAQSVLDAYISAGRHFLAVKLAPTEETEQQDGQDGTTDTTGLTATGISPQAPDPEATRTEEVPPMQFTVETTERYYPMAISQISAAEATEVLIYLWAQNEQQAVNKSTLRLDRNAIHRVDGGTASGTNYEELFSQKIVNNGSGTLITEFSEWFSWQWGYPAVTTPWVEAPDGVIGQGWLTRLRTVLGPDDMSFDYTFEDAAENHYLGAHIWVAEYGVTPRPNIADGDDANRRNAALALSPFALVGVWRIVGHRVWRRRKRKRHGADVQD